MTMNLFSQYRNVKDYGAVGDGVTNDTKAIQNAVDDGGIVYFPEGKYLTGTILLKSHGGLYLEHGAVIMASADFNDYNDADICPQNWLSKGEYANGKHLIMAIEQEDITLAGDGIIDGRATNWFTETNEEFKGTVYEKYKAPEWRLSQLCAFIECRNIKIHDMEFANSPYWTIFLFGGTDVIIHHIRIRNDMKVHNSDGISIDCCSNVIISDCDISSSDDSITLRSCSKLLKKHTGCKNVTISNCILHSEQAGIRVGLGNGTRIQYAVFSNIVIHARMGIIIDSSWAADPGAIISDINFNNIQITAHRPLLVTDTLRCPNPMGSVKDITFSHIRAVGEYPSGVTASAIGRVKSIRFFDLVMDYPDRGGNGLWDNMKSAGNTVFYAQNIQDLLLDNVVIRRNPSWTNGFKNDNCINLRCQNCSLDEASEIPEIDEWIVNSNGTFVNFYRD